MNSRMNPPFRPFFLLLSPLVSSNIYIQSLILLSLASFFFFFQIQVLLFSAFSVFLPSNSSSLFSKHFWFCLSSFVLVVSCECCSHFAPYTSLNKHVTTLSSPSILSPTFMAAIFEMYSLLSLVSLSSSILNPSDHHFLDPVHLIQIIPVKNFFVS